MANIADEQQQQDEGMVKEAGAKAKEGVQTAASAAGEKAGQLRQQASQKIQEQIDQRSTDVGSQARSVAGALRDTTGNLREEGKTGAATVAEQAADKIEQLGGYLERMDGQSIMRDIQGFARSRPWALAGIGMVTGFIGARFAKASGSGSSDGRTGGTDGFYATPALPPAGTTADAYGTGADIYTPAVDVETPRSVGAMAAHDTADMPLGRDPDRPEA